jgi:hypothetical protein
MFSAQGTGLTSHYQRGSLWCVQVNDASELQISVLNSSGVNRTSKAELQEIIGTNRDFSAPQKYQLPLIECRLRESTTPVSEKLPPSQGVISSA